MRPQRPGDLGWILLTHGELYASEFGFNSDFEINIANKIVTLFGEGGLSFNRFWIAEADGVRAGSIAVSQKSDATAFINFVLVLDKFRGRGIAEQLFDIATHYCRNHDFETIELETYSCLVSARKLYAKLGFEIVSTESDVKLFGQNLEREFWALKL